MTKVYIVMSKATKRKHVTREVVEDDVELIAGQIIVKVLCGRGNNLHEVQGPDGAKFLVSMPSKFRKNVWIKRGDYVVVEPIKEGHKVQAEIAHILYPMQIKTLKEQRLWPEEFMESMCSASVVAEKRKSVEVGASGDSSSDDEDLFRNTNHPAPLEIDTDSCSSESDTNTNQT